ncbi:MAG TPA: alpha-1,2-fucosyltransferase [Burkholderiales bacterium]
MQKFITMSQLTSSEGFGSQMANFAALYAVSRKTGHRIVFLDHWIGGKGLMLHVPFVSLPLEVLPMSAIGASEAVAVFAIDSRVVVDSRVFELDENLNYDIRHFFTSYRYWYPQRQAVQEMFRFKPEIGREAAQLLAAADARGREIVSVSVRRTDFLSSPYHHNLSPAYYADAFAQFRGDNYLFLVFSDDMEWCRAQFGRRANVAFAPPASSHYVDMCAISLCQHHIVANSSFGVWGALLNRNLRKKVVCPSRFLKTDLEIPYINYAWHPDDWVALDDL